MFAYCFSAIGIQEKELLKSLKSLALFVDRDHVTVINTPPYTKNDSAITKYAVLEKRENVTEAFRFNYRRYGRFGEKFQCLNLKNKNLMFLDNDTFVKRNPLYLFEGDFSVSGRVDSAFLYMNLNDWYRYSRVPMINTGVLVFKDYIHLRLFDWLVCEVNKVDVPKFYTMYHHKDQIVFSKIVSDLTLKVRYLSEADCCFIWESENKHDATITHGAFKPLHLFFYNDWLKRMYSYYFR
jgi:hypothetical protein